MNLDRKKKLEYEEQLFRFSSEHFLESFKNCLMETTQTTINRMASNIKKKLLPEAANSTEFCHHLTTMTDHLQNAYVDAMETAFQNNRALAVECMSIPEHVLLKEDCPIRIGLQVDATSVDAEIKKINNDLTSTRIMEQKILAEMSATLKVLTLQEHALAFNIPTYANPEPSDASIRKMLKVFHGLDFGNVD